MASLNLNVTSTILFIKNDNNSFFHSRDISYSIKIYLNAEADATDIPNATLIIGPVADLNFNFVSTFIN
jgi:hypothetical protein